MTSWSNFNNLIMAMAMGMGKKGNGKGKGNGKVGKGCKGGKGGKGGKSQQHQADAAAAAPDQYCTCCGKTNHVKSECHHRGKQCDNCGKPAISKGSADYR